MDDLFSALRPQDVVPSSNEMSVSGKQAYKAPTFQLLRLNDTQGGGKNPNTMESGSVGS